MEGNLRTVSITDGTVARQAEETLSGLVSARSMAPNCSNTDTHTHRDTHAEREREREREKRSWKKPIQLTGHCKQN